MVKNKENTREPVKGKGESDLSPKGSGARKRLDFDNEGQITKVNERTHSSDLDPIAENSSNDSNVGNKQLRSRNITV